MRIRYITENRSLQTNIKSIDDISDMLNFVEEELEYIDDQSSYPDISNDEYLSFEKDYRALTAIKNILLNHKKALNNSNLMKGSIFVYDYDNTSFIGAIQLHVENSVAKILWLGSYNSSGKALLHKGISLAKDIGAKKINVTSKWGSSDFYRTHGFTISSNRKDNPITDVGSDLTKDISEQPFSKSSMNILLEYDRNISKQHFSKQLAIMLRKDNYYYSMLKDHDSEFQDSDEYLVDSFLNFLEYELQESLSKYIPWAILRYVQGEYKYEDVVFRFASLIDHFNTIKPYLKRNGKSMDIMTYSFKQIEDMYHDVHDTDLVSGKDLRKLKSQNIRNQSKILYDGELGFLVIPETKEASCYWGKGTRWCTSGDVYNIFNHYNDIGPLYIWIDDTGDRYQFHFHTFQFMDKNDSAIDHSKLKYFRNDHPILSKLFKEEERRCMFDRNIDINTKLDYAYYTVDSRIPALEEFMVTINLQGRLMNYVVYFAESYNHLLSILMDIKPFFNTAENYETFKKSTLQRWERSHDPR